MIHGIDNRVRTAVNTQADQIKKEWLFKRPRLELPNIRRVSLTDIRNGAFQKQFPGWYKMNIVEQNDEWWSGTPKDFTLKILGGVRNWYKEFPLEKITHQYIVRDHFSTERWGRTNMQWYEWFVFLHEIGKMTTMQMRNDMTTFVGHELAGAQLAEKWLTAIDIQPAAASYLQNMTVVSGLLDSLMHDQELTHKGILIHARKNLGKLSQYELLELLILDLVTLDVSILQKTNPSEYERRHIILTRAFFEVLGDLELEHV
jgi:hypothetical protein